MPGPSNPSAPISRAQRDFILSLLDEREVEPKNGETLDDIKAKVSSLNMGQASDWITRLKSLPKREGAEQPTGQPEVEAGRYAVENGDGELRFYRVDKPTKGRWAGYTFVSVQASDEFHGIRNRATRNAILAKIAADSREAAIRYGRELGRCSRCGRTLTNRVSRELAIGPICGGRMFGDGFAAEVSAARESLEARGLDPDEKVAEDEPLIESAPEPGAGLVAQMTVGEPVELRQRADEIEPEPEPEQLGLEDDPFAPERAEVALAGKPDTGACPICPSGRLRALDAEGTRRCDGCGETFG